jgi:hypothetical protein
MNKQKLNRMPQSIAEFGIDHQIWTDRDLAKFCVIAFAFGTLIGVAVAWH